MKLNGAKKSNVVFRCLTGCLLVITTAMAWGAGAPDTSRPPLTVDAISVVRLHTRAVPDARSRATLGPEREGTGIVIDSSGLILTIGYLVQEAEAVQAEQLVIAGLKRMRWSEADLRAHRKGEPKKVDLAWKLRSQTTLPLAWIAERLNLGTRGHLAWLWTSLIQRQWGKKLPQTVAGLQGP